MFYKKLNSIRIKQGSIKNSLAETGNVVEAWDLLIHPFYNPKIKSGEMAVELLIESLNNQKVQNKTANILSQIDDERASKALKKYNMDKEDSFRMYS